MSNNSLPLKELSINDVFNGRENVKYEIPIYQRNYAWGKEEIGALVGDIWDACEKKNGVYYIGTLVTYDKGDNTYEVIDGQQRLTTLFLLLKALNLTTGNKLTYRARPHSMKALEIIDKKVEHPINELDKGIMVGYLLINQAFKELVSVERMKDFIDYLLYKVRIIHYSVPRDVDLNHYFEVMNSRGEQLEKHEIVKANLMNVLNDRDKSKFATIWEACSEMNTYIQTKVSVRTYFKDNMKDFKFYNGSFDDLPDVNESASEPSTLKSLIHASVNHTDKNSSNDDSKNSMFQPIIDFPNFLLIVLKITRMEDGDFNPYTFILDDKELINEFDKAMNAQPGSDFVKHFGFNLLLIRYLLDNYVVHHANVEETTVDNPWKLQRWQIEDKNRYPKNLSDDNKHQNKLVQLLSMFEVSFTARQRKNYLFFVLYHLLKNRDLGDYFDFLEELAKKYFFDIYMVQESLNQINAPKPGSFDQAIIKDGHIESHIINSNITSDSFSTIYGDGQEKTKGIPLFVFNYMDYLLWAKYAKNLAGEELKRDDEKRVSFFAELGCNDFGLDVFKQFYFSRSRRSLEHYYPQANINSGISEDQINCFGNFAMIGSDANSSGSNWTPKAKLLHYLDSSKKIQQVGIASLKFRIMMQMCSDNDESNSREDGHEWMFEDIQRHQRMMLKILFGK